MDLGIEDGRRPTIADVPGLIEGASSGAGLGHAFLRHVERTRILLHVVDGAARDPRWDHDVIRDELAAHDPALLEKPMLVVFNKIDLPAAREAWPAFRSEACARPGCGPWRSPPTAARASTTCGPPWRRCCPTPRGSPSRPSRPASSSTGSRRPATGSPSSDEDGAYRVPGKRIERLVAQTNFDNEESAERFQRELVRTGIDGALRKAGIRPGERGAHRRVGAGVGAARGRALTGTSDMTAAPRRPSTRRRRSCPVRWASSAARSTRSTTATSRSPRRRARRWASSACCSSRRPTPPHKPGRPVTAAEHRFAMVAAGDRRQPRASAASPSRSTAAGRRTRWTRSRGCRRRGLRGRRGSSCRRMRSRGCPTWREPGAHPRARAARRGAPRAGRGADGERGSGERFPGREDRVRFLPGPLLPISGSVVRRRVAAGRSIRYLVPDAVARYIAQHRLYLEPA